VGIIFPAKEGLPSVKAIPMRRRLVGKRISGFLWAGPGKKWQRKENYFQLEDDRLVTALFGTSAGSFWIRCRGATCEIMLKGKTGRVLGTTIMSLPGGRKK
jgi:hypothetical protein